MRNNITSLVEDPEVIIDTLFLEQFLKLTSAHLTCVSVIPILTCLRITITTLRWRLYFIV